ncbi:hypothetical protein LINPERPRIM_LOCUS6452 [Linum perenne]
MHYITKNRPNQATWQSMELTTSLEIIFLQSKINHGIFVQSTSILAQLSINPRKPRKSATHGQGYKRERKRDGHQELHGNPLLAISSPKDVDFNPSSFTLSCTLL